MSPSDQPLEIRITLSREEAITFLENLAGDSTLRKRFEEYPGEVLAENGIEVSPAEAIPTSVVAPDPDSIHSAIERLRAPEALVPWNAQSEWAFFPYIGLLAKPMEGGGSETT